MLSQSRYPKVAQAAAELTLGDGAAAERVVILEEFDDAESVHQCVMTDASQQVVERQVRWFTWRGRRAAAWRWSFTAILRFINSVVHKL